METAIYLVALFWFITTSILQQYWIRNLRSSRDRWIKVAVTSVDMYRRHSNEHLKAICEGRAHTITFEELVDMERAKARDYVVLVEDLKPEERRELARGQQETGNVKN